jgi:hypothetical protein
LKIKPKKNEKPVNRPSLNAIWYNHDFFCVGAMYSGEYDACDVTHCGQAYFSSLPGVDIHSE